jgi:2Fe-2S ferredoxin
MAIVRVEPAGFEFDMKPGESLAEVAWRLGYGWPTMCWGQAECMTCFVRILDGDVHCNPPGDEELAAMRLRMPARVRGPMVRLACRLTVSGDGLVVEKRGVSAPPPSGPGDRPAQGL